MFCSWFLPKRIYISNIKEYVIKNFIFQFNKNDNRLQNFWAAKENLMESETCVDDYRQKQDHTWGFEMLKVSQGGSISTEGCSRHLANTFLQQMAGYLSVGYSNAPLVPMQTIYYTKDYDLTILFSQNLSAIFYKTSVTMRNLLNKYNQYVCIINQKKNSL